jgi:O-methyltransferase
MNLVRRMNAVLKNLRDDARYYNVYILAKLGKLLLPEYRFKWPHMAWWLDTSFSAYLARFDELEGFNTDRRWMIYQLLRLIENVAGDTAECGVFKGAASYLICKANLGSRRYGRHHFMFDSFEGVSEPGTKDGTYWTKGALACDVESVKHNLSEFPASSYHKGWIPERFCDAEDHRFAFVHIDVDLYEPTYESISFFYPRLSPGGLLVCDDYGFTSCPGASEAIDEFLKDKPEKMIALCSGGGFLIKGTATSAHFDPS